MTACLASEFSSVEGLLSEYRLSAFRHIRTRIVQISENQYLAVSEIRIL